MITENILKVFKGLNEKADESLGIMFMNIFNTLPNCYKVYFDNNKVLKYLKSDKEFENIRTHMDYRLDIRETMKNMEHSGNFTMFCYSSNEYIVIYTNNLSPTDQFACNVLINFTITDMEDATEIYENIYTNNIKAAFPIISKFFVIGTKQEKVDFGIAAIDSSNSVYTSWYEYKAVDVDIKENYNDDIPYDRMKQIIEEDKSSLMLFYGEPGTGKTTLIKHFITEYPDKNFIFMDGDLLINVSKEKLMSYFLECQDTIFILEDCEKALMNRENSFNPVMSILLNLTDGVISDILNIKLICTFNTNINNIDPALIRKGRLSLKYEFKKLSKEKCRKIANDNSINEDMSLANVYNIKEENDFSKKNQKKIGF